MRLEFLFSSIHTRVAMLYWYLGRMFALNLVVNMVLALLL